MSENQREHEMIDYSEVEGRFLPSDSPVRIFGDDTPDMLAGLARIGLVFDGTFDDMKTFESIASFKVLPDSPMRRIVRAHTNGALPLSVGELLDRVINDVREDQFGKNWAEYLEP